MVTVTCLVDNCVLPGSSMWGEHGVSFLIESINGKVLFDCGQSGDVLLHNAAQLKKSLDEIDFLVISHAHYDHTGGMEKLCLQRNQPIPLIAHTDLFRHRFSKRENEFRAIDIDFENPNIQGKIIWQLSKEPKEILPDIWTSGEIKIRNDFEGRSKYHMIQENGVWKPDPYLDDMSMVIKGEKSLMLICGCCHAGLLNTLAVVRDIFDMDIAMILGGTHLITANPEMIGLVVDKIKTLNADGRLPGLYLNHCTGESALQILREKLGECVHACPAGTIIEFK